MSLRMNHNVISMVAHRNLYKVDRESQTSIDRLSSGLRVNQAWDDPAAMAVSDRMRMQIGSMVETERNASYAINLLSTAEAGLNNIDDKLTRMRALAVEASNGTLSSLDRSYLDHEFQQLKSEINRVAEVTRYNGIKLLDGTYSQGASGPNGQGIKFHLGTYNVSNQDYYHVNLADMRLGALGLDSVSLTNTALSQAAIGTIDAAQILKSTEQTRVGSYVSRLQLSLESMMIHRENTVTSESTVRDADMAETMSSLTRAQIRMQTTIAMTSQANQLPNIVAGLF
ncbi:MAG: flagellin [Calditrichaeota bacterium]|nr:flagellin [Candidatus Cloacimonadota bacterium]MCB1048049.1 flagellin [Calditrichota bacterium]MCB9475145.1 flagellin [Candidatus Delongbacteria bacterium]